MVPSEQDVETAWRRWLLKRNRQGARTVLWLVIVFYPLFGVLDWLVAPRDQLVLLYSSRGFITLYTLVMFRVVRMELFERLHTELTAVYMAIVGGGIAVMIVVMGGYVSPYYAGLNLVMMTAGLLFVWPARVALATHVAIVLMYLVPNAFSATRDQVLGAVTNFFFLGTTATIVVASQTFAYRTQREQVKSQLIIELAKVNLEQAHEQLKQLDRFKSQFFTNITHELKTPLAMILAPLELMLDGELGSGRDGARPTLQSMYRNGMKLLKLIADLLDLSKLEESRLRLSIARQDMVAYLRTLIVQVQPLAQRKGIEIRLDVDVEVSWAWCDIDRMERVFVNLLSNAMKFTPPRGNIVVTLRETGEVVRIEVRDDGPGFPSGMAARVFERFFQVDMAGTRKHGGTGIGLALAKELVELHGGRIWAESELGKGAAFTVELRKGRDHFGPDVLERPPAEVEKPKKIGIRDGGVFDWTLQLAQRDEFRLLEIDAATEQRVVERDPDEHERLYSVLVVDDSPDIIRVVHLALRHYLRVFAASDGKKGFDLAVSKLPSLIITDYMMPELDGLELVRKLRADPRTRHIPVIMLTARSDVEDRVAGFDTGVNVYLTKPFSAKELLSTVRSLVDLQEKAADILLTGRMDSLETIAGGLAHEINNPLNYVKQTIHLVRRDLEHALRVASSGRAPTAEELRKLAEAERRMARLFETADSGIRRIAGTVELMRRYSREGYSRTLQSYDVFAAVRDVLGVVVPATGRNVTLETSFEGEGCVECVPEELNQVLTNLVQNAVEAAPDDGTGRVRVRGSVEGEWVVLSVADNGPGIRPEDRANIFTPFFSTKEPGRGMGMGLTITRRVVQSLGGTIHVVSEPGAGAEFVVRIPLRQMAARRSSAPAPAAATSAAS